LQKKGDIVIIYYYLTIETIETIEMIETIETILIKN